MVNRMTDAAVRRMVTRTTDRDLILLTDPNWLKMVKWNVENIFKDIVISVMSMVPWLQYKIYEELNNADYSTEEYEELIRQIDGNEENNFVDNDNDPILVVDEDN